LGGGGEGGLVREGMRISAAGKIDGGVEDKRGNYEKKATFLEGKGNP